jgi:hypothetical protein
VHFTVSRCFGLAFEQADYMTHNWAGEFVRIEFKVHPDQVAIACSDVLFNVQLKMMPTHDGASA